MNTSALTVREVAALTRRNEDTVRRWIRARKLPAVRTPGGGYLVTRAELAKVLPGVVETETSAERKRRAAADWAAIDAL